MLIIILKENLCKEPHRVTFTAVSVKVCRGSSRVAKLAHDRNMQLQQQPAVETTDKNVYVTVGTAVKLHFPVVHVFFVLSAELRPCWFMFKERRAVAKMSISLQPAPNKRWEPSRSSAEDIDGIMKTDDSHINVSPQFILIYREVPCTNGPPPHQLTGHPLCICIAKEKLRVHRGLRVGVEHKWFPHCELRYPSTEKTRGRIQNGSVMMFYVGGQPVWGG